MIYVQRYITVPKVNAKKIANLIINFLNASKNQYKVNAPLHFVLLTVVPLVGAVAKHIYNHIKDNVIHFITFSGNHFCP